MTAELARLGDPDLAFWLTRSVARAAGINLSEAMKRGRLSVPEYGEMVTRCRKCRHAETCTAWLAMHGAGAARVPEHCANADRLNALLPCRTEPV